MNRISNQNSYTWIHIHLNWTKYKSDTDKYLDRLQPNGVTCFLTCALYHCPDIYGPKSWFMRLKPKEPHNDQIITTTEKNGTNLFMGSKSANEFGLQYLSLGLHPQLVDHFQEYSQQSSYHEQASIDRSGSIHLQSAWRDHTRIYPAHAWQWVLW